MIYGLSLTDVPTHNCVMALSRKSAYLEVVAGRILQVNHSTFQASLRKNDKVSEWPCIRLRGYEGLQTGRKQNFAQTSVSMS